MRRVLLISPYFPPHTGAASHRLRILAPHLLGHGWDPTILTVDPDGYEERLDPGLLSLVPSDLEIVRCTPFPAKLTRRLGFGDLGLRALGPLYSRASALLRGRRYDAFLITLPPHHAAVLGPLLKRRFGIPFIIDYQDPWVGAWGLTVGGGTNGAADWRSRASRLTGVLFEPQIIRAADAIIGVSKGTYESVLARIPVLPRPVCAEVPLGGESRDFEAIRRARPPNRFFEPAQEFNLCYVGTIAPLGYETLRALLRAAKRVRDERPDLAARLRLRFFGTSMQISGSAPQRVVPLARELGVDDLLVEVPQRIDYLDALTVLTDATANLILGSTEAHYTASKLYPVLLARRPVLTVFHEGSLVSSTLARWGRPPSIRLVTYGDDVRAEDRVKEIAEALTALMEDPRYDPTAVDMAQMVCSGEDLAGHLARVFDEVATRRLRAWAR